MSVVAAIVRTLNLPGLWRIETLHSDQLSARTRKSGRILEIAIIAIILAVAARQGAQTYLKNLATAAFYQTEFGPALNFACNGEYNRIKPNDQASEFLARKSSNLDSCNGIEGLPHRTIDGFDSSTVYLQLAAAGAWRVFGFNWGSLFVIAAALTAGFAIACYGLLRSFAASRLLCATLTFAVLSSGPVVSQIAHLRDFSKAPFVIGALAFLAASVLRPHQGRSILLLAAGAGALVSIGLGFRPDSKVVLPVALLSPLLLIGGASLRSTVLRGSLIWIGFGVGYIVFQLPLSLIGRAEVSMSATFIPHIFILGFAESFLHGALGMSDVTYSILRPYLDGFVHATAHLFGGASPGSTIAWGSVEYDQVCFDFLRSILLLVPHDTLLRIFYTANAIGHQPLNIHIWGPLLLLATPILLLARPRSFLFLVLSLGTLIAALSLQYDPRHAFYMALLGPLVIALSASALLDIARYVRVSGFRLPSGMKLKAGLLVLPLALIAASLAGASQLLAASQRKALQHLATTYSGLEWKAIRFQEIQGVVEPRLADQDDNRRSPAFALKNSTENESMMPRGVASFSRVTLKLGSNERTITALPIELSWKALQEEATFKKNQFVFSTGRDGYAIESNPILGLELSSLLASKEYSGQRLWLSVTGETPGGGFQVGVLNRDKSKFAFNERLPFGKWQYFKQIEITPDLEQFTIVFSHAGGRSTLRVDSAELVTSPEAGCWPDGRVETHYMLFGQNVDLGGFSLPRRAGLITYYFPQGYYPPLVFSGLKVGGMSTDCIVDWSVAKNFPAGTVPAEMLLVDGKLQDFQRGSWKSIWRNFVN